MHISNITLDRETATTVYGNIYGLSYLKEQDDFTVEVFIDCTNKRIKVLDYQAATVRAMVEYLNYLARENGFGKVVLVSREEDWETCISYGYILEGFIQEYFRGEKPGYCLTRFFDKERRISQFIEDEDEILQEILAQPSTVNLKKLSEDSRLRSAGIEDIPALAELFTAVFSSYPAPLYKPEYLEQVVGKKSHFKIIEHQGKIVSAASAEINRTNMTAEMTDCATLPDYRGQGLMSILINALEIEMKKEHIHTLYSLSRALSHGINLVFHRHGYTYGGRLINNCNIMGKFEDMNLWVKHLNVKSLH
ncbi:putative beta-lysine N-acetyltransferase [Phosphitispora sp. TUW77]|uniref:putative beta-lysine N-acetyltransferase n=1 Tax=Phosphitispora sp. TUW77 TaxID=3152361 RepID=UPI003AB6F3AF